MLHELRVENLLLMERAELRLAPGLNALTGETGAGKTLLAHALDLLLGGRARRGIVRRESAETYVEGVFSLPPELAGLHPIPTGAEEIVLARRVWPDGRSRAYVCGRSATLADLRELGGRLMAFYGQHEHRKLMLAAVQLEVLDAHCGPGQLALRADVAAGHDRVRALRARAEELHALAGARDRELDLLAFELDEIEAAAPSEEEQAVLVAERERLRNVESLRLAAAAGAQALAPEDGSGASELLARAAGALEQAAAFDPQLAVLAERLHSLRYEAEDLGGELIRYLTGIDEVGGSERLEDVEARLALFARLERKHGGTIADVLAHAERCRARRAELAGSEVALEEVERDLDAAHRELTEVAGRLGSARRSAAPDLAAVVQERLAELAMADARFGVDVQSRDGGCGPNGADTVELLIAPNSGLPMGPLRDIASGGELSRVMLALLSVAHGGESGEPDTSPMLVFDEIDAGIGGHTARAVGEHLRALAARRQILCITHLPQVASVAERHFRIEKDSVGGMARTTVAALEGDAVVSELVRMLGARDGDRAASQHARDLLRAA